MMDSIVHPQSLIAQLAGMPDPRRKQGQRYPSAALFTLLLLGALSGEASLRGIWMQTTAWWTRLRAVLGCPTRSMPVYTTLWNFVAALDAEAVDLVIATWLLQMVGPPKRLQGLSVDGKVLRGTRRLADQVPGIRLLACVRHELGLVVAQQRAVGDDEVEALLRLVQTVSLQDCVITLDAGLLFASTARAILNQGGHYLGTIKENHKELADELHAWLQDHLAGGIGARQGPAVITHEKGHGRQEVRMLWVVPAAEFGWYLAHGRDWPGVAQIGWVRRRQRRYRDGPWSEEEVLFVTSLPVDALPPAALLQFIRNHWTIENRVHYVRDVAYGEDRHHGRRCAQVLASAQNTAITLIRRHDFAYIPDGHREVRADPTHAMHWIGADHPRPAEN